MMGCANNNRIKWQITVAVSDWVLFPNIAFPPQICTIQKHIKTPGTNKAKWSLQTARILVTGYVQIHWQLTVAVSADFIFQNIGIFTTQHCAVNYVNYTGSLKKTILPCFVPGFYMFLYCTYLWRKCNIWKKNSVRHSPQLSAIWFCWLFAQPIINI